MNIRSKIKIRRYIQKSKVPFLYRYRCIDSRELPSIFERQMIYIPSPEKFNDPFDCKPIPDFGKRLKNIRKFQVDALLKREPNASQNRVNEFLSDPNTINFAQRENFDNVIKDVMSKIGVYCLSEVNNDILMWAHYTKSHEGICLIFDTQIPNSIFNQAFSVQYKVRYAKVNVLNINSLNDFNKTVLTKSRHWKYEKERRIIMTEQEGGFGEYKFPPEALAGVILGARFDYKKWPLIYNWMKKYPINLKLYKSIPNPNKYCLDIVPNHSVEVTAKALA